MIIGLPLWEMQETAVAVSSRLLFRPHGWGMGIGWIIAFILLIVLVWIIVKAAKKSSDTGMPANKSPMDILKERYARGEIDKEEFEKRKKDLA